MTGTDLQRTVKMTPAILSDDEIRRSWRIAEALAISKAFPDPENGQLTTALAFARMLIGSDLGLSPTQALMGIAIVKGRPMVSATLLASFVKQAPDYDYRVIDHDETKCSIEFGPTPMPGKDDDGEWLPWSASFGTSTYTLEDAKRANLVKAKGAYETVPKAMMFARAMSQGVRWFCPDATGGVPVYVEGEIEKPVELTAGTGDGEATGLDLGPAVEKVLARAAELNHPALADRATAELTLGGQSPEATVEWVAKAEKELDEFEAQPTATAEVEQEVAVDARETIAERRRVAEQLDRDAADAKAAGKDDEAANLEAGATEVRAEAHALEIEASEIERGVETDG